jgi:NADPH-dependent curcumin reductase CurA
MSSTSHPPVESPAPPLTSREIRLASRPTGLPTAANFELVSVPRPSPRDEQVLVRNLFMSVDPYMRGRMADAPSYVPPFALHEPLTGSAVGEVVESRAGEFRPGDIVTSSCGWREYFVATPDELLAVDRTIRPLSVHLGALGMTGLTAWAGLQLAELKPEETLFISGAAGAVGSVAGQLAKIHGCRVIGSAGSAEKVSFLRETCGFDDAFDYHDGAILAQLQRVAPEGIDVYFDNVGGEALEAALTALRVHGRIIACGGISGYNEQGPRPGPTNLFNVIGKRLTMRGLLVGDWLDHRAEFTGLMSGYLSAGTVKSRETVVDGIDRAVEAFLGLFRGTNLGKMIVKLT